MGDLSAEPSMEEILSSIKRIIAEEESPRARRPARAPAAAALSPPPLGDEPNDDEVLELSDPMPAARPDPEPRLLRPSASRTEAPEPIVSEQAAAASRGALDSLSRLMVKPEPGSDGSLEGLVREMLRPMLREWLDANLPELVEGMVAKEIKRITGAAG